MTDRRQRFLMAAALAGVTIALGFLGWWTFVIVAFVGSFYLQRKFAHYEAIRLATFAPATGWLLTCLVRDLSEGGRISAKLSTLLSLRFSGAVYAAVFLLVCLPSFFAAYSGATFSKTFR